MSRFKVVLCCLVMGFAFTWALIWAWWAYSSATLPSINPLDWERSLREMHLALGLAVFVYIGIFWGADKVRR